MNSRDMLLNRLETVTTVIESKLTTEKEFFDVLKKSERAVFHFFRDSTFRCKILDKHLTILAAKHVETFFGKVDVEKSPFLVSRLKIRILPTMVPVVDGMAKEHILGFDSLGGTDDFSTEMLEWRLGCAEVINYEGDTSRPPALVSKPAKTLKSGIRRTNFNRDPDSDDYEDF
ncbi:thioredoxin domain-containing protein 9-like [Octopus sinensis]|uniref:Thioredoxin domain-containing protein 9 n=1 Tax=Octopus sinensis TaxID=2607531 RepID=A0A7E6EM59_9MOLL|nr:thioredoxin domain-containing protein 9-like [Octopus sinensis]